jgi:hypothetical protein
MHDSVTVHMNATTQQVWDLVSDVTRIGSYSPETFEAEWLEGAAGPAVGARFRGHVKRNGRGPTYWSPCVVTSCVPGAEFGFDVVQRDRAVNTWTYRIEPSAEGCDVTESFRLADMLPLRIYWALFGWTRGKTNREGMRRTLEAIRAEVEQASA